MNSAACYCRHVMVAEAFKPRVSAARAVGVRSRSPSWSWYVSVHPDSYSTDIHQTSRWHSVERYSRGFSLSSAWVIPTRLHKHIGQRLVQSRAQWNVRVRECSTFVGENHVYARIYLNGSLLFSYGAKVYRCIGSAFGVMGTYT